MDKKDLETKFSSLEKKYPNYRVNNTEMFNLLYESNKLYIQIINDFNEKTGTYSSLLLFFTIVIAILTAIMAFPIAESIFLWVIKK